MCALQTTVVTYTRRAVGSVEQTVRTGTHKTADRVVAQTAVADPGILFAFVHVRAGPSVGQQCEPGAVTHGGQSNFSVSGQGDGFRSRTRIGT